jgi:hypothetical protein
MPNTAQIAFGARTRLVADRDPIGGFDRGRLSLYRVIDTVRPALPDRT